MDSLFEFGGGEAREPWNSPSLGRQVVCGVRDSKVTHGQKNERQHRRRDQEGERQSSPGANMVEGRQVQVARLAAGL